MKFPPFLLDQWLAQKHTVVPSIEYDLGSSTGPVWTLRELLAISGDGALEALLDKPVFYPPGPGSLALRTAIAALDGVDPGHVQVTTGGAEALLILFFLAAQPEANVILPNPGYPAYAATAESLGIAIRYYQSLDPDEIGQLIDKNTSFLVVNSPQNPTGAVVSDEQMQALHDLCAERGVQFVSDQVYHPIYHGPEKRSAAPLPHATTIGDFSKALCLSGLRIGWLVEHDPQRRERYLTARNYFTAASNTFGEQIATLALQHSDQIYARARGVAQANLALLDQLFAEHDDVVQWQRPAGGMTAFPKLTGVADTRPFCQELVKQGVLVVPGDCFGQPAHIRIGFAASGDKFPRAVERLSDCLSAYTEG